MMKHVVMTAALALAAVGAASAAGFAVQEINSPGPALRMSSAGLVAGFYVAKAKGVKTANGKRQTANGKRQRRKSVKAEMR